MDPAGQTLIEIGRADDPFRPQSMAAVCWRGGAATVESVLFRPQFCGEQIPGVTVVPK